MTPYGSVGGTGGTYYGSQTGFGSLTKQDLQAAAWTALTEARDDGVLGMARVIDTMNNIAQLQGTSIAQVATERGIFTGVDPTLSTNPNEQRNFNDALHEMTTNSSDWQSAQEAAQRALTGDLQGVTMGATDYMTRSLYNSAEGPGVMRRWGVPGLQPMDGIDDQEHVFFKSPVLDANAAAKAKYVNTLKTPIPFAQMDQVMDSDLFSALPDDPTVGSIPNLSVRSIAQVNSLQPGQQLADLGTLAQVPQMQQPQKIGAYAFKDLGVAPGFYGDDNSLDQTAAVPPSRFEQDFGQFSPQVTSYAPTQAYAAPPANEATSPALAAIDNNFGPGTANFKDSFTQAAPATPTPEQDDALGAIGGPGSAQDQAQAAKATAYSQTLTPSQRFERDFGADFGPQTITGTPGVDANAPLGSGLAMPTAPKFTPAPPADTPGVMGTMPEAFDKSAGLTAPSAGPEALSGAQPSIASTPFSGPSVSPKALPNYGMTAPTPEDVPSAPAPAAPAPPDVANPKPVGMGDYGFGTAVPGSPAAPAPVTPAAPPTVPGPVAPPVAPSAPADAPSAPSAPAPAPKPVAKPMSLAPPGPTPEAIGAATMPGLGDRYASSIQNQIAGGSLGMPAPGMSYAYSIGGPTQVASNIANGPLAAAFSGPGPLGALGLGNWGGLNTSGATTTPAATTSSAAPTASANTGSASSSTPTASTGTGTQAQGSGLSGMFGGIGNALSGIGQALAGMFGGQTTTPADNSGLD